MFDASSRGMGFRAMVSGAGGANSGRVLTVVRFAETMDANGHLHRPFQFNILVLCVFWFLGQKEKYCLPHQIWCAVAGEGSVNTAVKQGPNVSMIAPVFSNDLNGYQGFMARTTRPGGEKTMRHTIGIDVSKDTLDAYRLSD